LNEAGQALNARNMYQYSYPDLEMRTLMDIYQRGGRITRSTRSTRPPASKPTEGKTRERHKNVLNYLG
jgi:hypothetical protein